jgi:hypothetical protein
LVCRDFFISSRLVPPVILKREELLQYDANRILLIAGPSTYKALNICRIDRQRLLVLVVATQATMVGSIFDEREMRRGGGVIANVMGEMPHWSNLTWRGLDLFNKRIFAPVIRNLIP